MKKCTNPDCGKMNADEMRFCEECGSTLSATTTPTHSKEEFKNKIKDIGTDVIGGIGAAYARKRFNANKESIINYVEGKEKLIPDKLSLCDGEVPIKQFFCASEQFKLIGLYLGHFVQVTNKRVIYCRMGGSILGTKVEQAEIPLDDVASVSFKRGYKINLIFLILSVVLVISAFSTFVGMFAMSNKNSMVGSIMQTAGLKVGAVILSILWTLILSALAYFSIKSILKKYFNLYIGSKSGSNYPISTGGIEKFGLNDDFLEQFVPTIPTDNIDTVESVLNAMILDIQQLGDYGIEKWQEK